MIASELSLGHEMRASEDALTRLGRWMRGNDIHASDLAAVIGCSRQLISRIVTGKEVAGARIAARIEWMSDRYVSADGLRGTVAITDAPQGSNLEEIKRLSSWMNDCGFSLTAMAAVLGIPVRTVGHILKRRLPCPASVAQRIEQHTGGLVRAAGLTQSHLGG